MFFISHCERFDFAMDRLRETSMFQHLNARDRHGAVRLDMTNGVITKILLEIGLKTPNDRLFYFLSANHEICFKTPK